MKRVRTLLMAMVLGLGLGTAVVVPAAAASASTVKPAKICSTRSTIHGAPVPPGQEVCEYGDSEVNFGGSVYQDFVVGTDGAVWETWQNCANCAFGPWISLGGIAKSPVYFENWGTELKIDVVGTTGHLYCKYWNAPGAAGTWWPSWTTWHQCD
jgi:hypothetical protein